MGRRQLIKENYFIFKSLTNCSPVSSFLSGDNDCSHSCIFCQVFVAIDPPTMPWIARRDNKVPNRFPISQIALLNNARHSWILNFVILAAFSANQQSGARAKNWDIFVLFSWISIPALVFFSISEKMTLAHGKRMESRFMNSVFCVFVFLCEFALFGPDLVSPFLGITLSPPAQILSEICRIVCLWKRQDIFPIHKKPSCTLESLHPFSRHKYGGALDWLCPSQH